MLAGKEAVQVTNLKPRHPSSGESMMSHLLLRLRKNGGLLSGPGAGPIRVAMVSRLKRGLDAHVEGQVQTSCSPTLCPPRMPPLKHAQDCQASCG